MREHLSHFSPHLLPYNIAIPPLLSLLYALHNKEATMPWKEMISVAMVVITTIAKELNKK
jgi:hypothetical protein